MQPSTSDFRVGGVGRPRLTWLLAGLLAAELLGLLRAAQGSPLPLTRFSLVVSFAALLTGLIPAIVRPSLASFLAGALAIVAASFLAIPFELAAIPELVAGHSVTSLPLVFGLRLINAAALGPLAFHLTARFPKQSAVTAGQLLTAYGLTGIVLLAMFYAPPGPRLPIAIGGFAWFAFLLVGSLVQVFAASRETASSLTRETQQARLLLIVFIIAYVPISLRLLGMLLNESLISYDFVLVGQLAWPVGITYIVLRHDLFNIDVTLRRALAYAVLSAGVLAIYFGLTAVLTATLTSWVPQFRGLAALVGLFAAAAAFTPLRRHTQYIIDRGLYPERLAFRGEVTAAREELSKIVRRSEVVDLLVNRLPPGLGATWGALNLDPEPNVAPAGQSPPAWGARLVVGGRPLGRYWLGPRLPGPAFDDDERSQLEGLAQQAALALAYAQTFEELAQLNRELEDRIADRTAQVVDQQRALAVLDERQRLARELHDSVTQTLFSISLSARNIRGLVQRDPDAAIATLVEQETAARQGLADMRALLAQLRGEAVGSVDVASRLRDHCSSLARQGVLHVELDCPDRLLLPAAAVNDFMSIAREALHNVIKHGETDRAVCTLAAGSDAIELVVTDNGRGFDPDAVHGRGMGLGGMRERAAALGGALEVASASPSGVSVRLRFPVPDPGGERSSLEGS